MEEMNNEVMNDVMDDVVEVCEPVDCGDNILGKVVIVAGVAVVAAVATVLYKKHKNKTNEENVEPKKRFTIFKKKSDVKEPDEILNGYVEEEV